MFKKMCLWDDRSGVCNVEVRNFSPQSGLQGAMRDSGMSCHFCHFSSLHSKSPRLEVTGISKVQSILPLGLPCSLEKAAISFQIGGVKPVVIVYVKMLSLL